MTAPGKTVPSWRDVLPVHPASELLPPLSPDELNDLAADIRANGMLNPIVIWTGPEGDNKRCDFLLDGRHRLDAAAQTGVLGVTEQGTLTLHRNSAVEDVRKKYYFGDDPYALAMSLNVRRRHLTAEQKRGLIGNLLKVDPTKSNRQIAELTKTSHPIVATERAKLEATGDVEKVSTSTDTKGRKQPVRKPRRSPEQRSAERVERARIAIEAINDVLTEEEKAALAAPYPDTWRKAIEVETGEQAAAPLAPPVLDEIAPAEIAAWKPTAGLRSFIERVAAISHEANTATFNEVALTENARKRLNKALQDISQGLLNLRGVAELAARKAAKGGEAA
jgi:hypothetical protein